MSSVTGTNGAGSGLPAPQGFGVFGNSDIGPGVVGFSNKGTALVARSLNGTAGEFTSNGAEVGQAVYARCDLGTAAVLGETLGAFAGVYGEHYRKGIGVYGRSYDGYGVLGIVQGPGTAIAGSVLPASTDTPKGWAGRFEGDVLMIGKVIVYGSLTKPGGSFRIDHPLDPGNKYLSHSFVESPDMLNIYNGLIQLDEHGAAIVELPEWFDALNHEFRYQLTAIGSPAPNLHIASEIERRSFRIAGGTPKAKVSWQVTGIRQDKWANANRIQVEEEKSREDRGRYLHPELFGEPEDKKVMPVPRPSMPHRPEERPAHRPPRPDLS